MKTKAMFILFAAVALTVTPLRAEEAKPEMKGASMNEQDAKKQGMEKKMQAMEAKPGAQAEVDYYTCKMHPAVHWPVPSKCPLCFMDLVPVFKKGSEAEPGEEIKKADDPHAGHH